MAARDYEAEVEVDFIINIKGEGICIIVCKNKFEDKAYKNLDQAERFIRWMLKRVCTPSEEAESIPIIKIVALPHLNDSSMDYKIDLARYGTDKDVYMDKYKERIEKKSSNPQYKHFFQSDFPEFWPYPQFDPPITSPGWNDIITTLKQQVTSNKMDDSIYANLNKQLLAIWCMSNDDDMPPPFELHKVLRNSNEIIKQSEAECQKIYEVRSQYARFNINHLSEAYWIDMINRMAVSTLRVDPKLTDEQLTTNGQDNCNKMDISKYQFDLEFSTNVENQKKMDDGTIPKKQSQPKGKNDMQEQSRQGNNLDKGYTLSDYYRM